MSSRTVAVAALILVAVVYLFFGKDNTAPQRCATEPVASSEVRSEMRRNPAQVALPTVRTRNDIAPELLEAEKHEIGVELGVQKGGFAYHNLRNWPSCKKYVLVDLWAMQDNYNDHANTNNATQEKTFRHAMQVLAKYSHKIEICRNLTTNCALRYPDEYFDFIFVDARHDYKGVLSDLEAWWPKIKYGGIISGHDYMTAAEVRKGTPDQDWGLNFDGTRNEGAVKGAVDEFFMNGTIDSNPHWRQVTVTYRESAWNTWLVRK